MKTLLTLISLLILITPLNAQDEIMIGFKQKNENLDYNSSDTLVIPYTLQLKGRLFPEKEDKIEVEITTDSDELNLYLAENKAQIYQSITKGKLVFKKNKKTQGNLQVLLDSLTKARGFITIKIKPDKNLKFRVDKSKEEHLITIDQGEKLIVLRKKKPKRDPNYNFYLGANFDLQDKLQANSFYSEIDVFLPGLFFKNKAGDLWGGLRAGLYKNNLETIFKNKAGNRVYLEIKENLPERDTITLEKKFGTVTPRVTFSNIGLYAQMLLRTYESLDGKFQAFVAPHAEIIQRTETTNFEIENEISLETFEIKRDSLIKREYRFMLARNQERTRKYYNTYFGLGFPAKFKSNDIEVFINPVIGYGDSALLNNRNDPGNLFGIIQFYLLELNSDIKLSGEVRKFFNANQDPLLVVNLSKSFNIESLWKSNKAKSEE